MVLGPHPEFSIQLVAWGHSLRTAAALGDHTWTMLVYTEPRVACKPEWDPNYNHAAGQGVNTPTQGPDLLESSPSSAMSCVSFIK